jgi:hypothetical protein
MYTRNPLNTRHIEQIGFAPHRSENITDETTREQLEHELAYVAMTRLFDAHGEVRDGAQVITASE